MTPEATTPVSISDKKLLGCQNEDPQRIPGFLEDLRDAEQLDLGLLQSSTAYPEHQESKGHQWDGLWTSSSWLSCIDSGLR